MLQYRSKNTPNGAWYAPNRDIVYLYPNLLKQVAIGLADDKIHHEPWLHEFAKEHGVTEEQIGDAMLKFIELMKYCLDPDCKHPVDALSKSGFLSMPPKVQILVAAKLGQIATGAFWHGVREVMSPDDQPASQKTMNEMAEACDKVSKILMNQAYKAPA